MVSNGLVSPGWAILGGAFWPPSRRLQQYARGIAYLARRAARSSATTGRAMAPHNTARRGYPTEPGPPWNNRPAGAPDRAGANYAGPLRPTMQTPRIRDPCQGQTRRKNHFTVMLATTTWPKSEDDTAVDSHIGTVKSASMSRIKATCCRPLVWSGFVCHVISLLTRVLMRRPVRSTKQLTYAGPGPSGCPFPTLGVSLCRHLRSGRPIWPA